MVRGRSEYQEWKFQEIRDQTGQRKSGHLVAIFPFKDT